MQKIIGGRIHFRLIPIFKENTSNVAPLIMKDTLYQPKKIPFYFQLTEECAFHCRLYQMPVGGP